MCQDFYNVQDRVENNAVYLKAILSLGISGDTIPNPALLELGLKGDGSLYFSSSPFVSPFDLSFQKSYMP